MTRRMRREAGGGSDRRPKRVAEQVRQVVTTFLREEARDPRIGLVTVTNVAITGDLQHATVHYVVHGGAAEQAQTAEGLAAAAGAVRRRIGAEMALRVVPEVVFELDKGSEHAAHIARLLSGIDKTGEDGEAGDAGNTGDEGEAG